MDSYEAVCFDLDGTLAVRERGVEAIHEAAFERVSREPFFEPADMRLVDHERLPEVESDVEQWTAVFEQLAEAFGVDRAVAEPLAEATVTEIREDPTYHERGDAGDVLRAVADSARVALVTNGSPGTQRRKLARLGLRDAFDTAVYCGPATDVPRKPSPTPFERALDALGVEPAAAVHVGNSVTADVAGAQAAGVDAVWFPTSDDEPGEVTPAFRVDTTVELRELLARNLPSGGV